MASSQLPSFFFFFFTILFSVLHRATSVTTCPTSCTGLGQSIRFPFRRNDQVDRCGYPGFELSCSNSTGQTILDLENSGGYIVQNIDYVSQTISINDPKYCLPSRFLDSFTLSDSPFESGNVPIEFTFYNCSSSENDLQLVSGSRIVDCMSEGTFMVVAVPTNQNNGSGGPPTSCKKIKTVMVPVLWPSWSNLENGVLLRWNVPDCKSCEERGGSCGFKDHNSQNIGCDHLPRSGLSRSAKYGIIVGVAIPGILCFIGIVGYLCGRARNYCHRRRQYDTEFVTSMTPTPMVIVTGLDGRTIESYPKTLLGESKRLPKPNDNTCPICLSEYQPKDILRTIPDCNHYFHVNCIDEWLRLKATCPLCRTSPDGSAIVTPSTSTSSSSSASSILLSP